MNQSSLERCCGGYRVTGEFSEFQHLALIRAGKRFLFLVGTNDFCDFKVLCKEEDVMEITVSARLIESGECRTRIVFDFKEKELELIIEKDCAPKLREVAPVVKENFFEAEYLTLLIF